MKRAAIDQEICSERRQGQKAVPDDIFSRLTEPQQQSLLRLENIGWSIKFVRRPLLEDRLIVVSDPTGRDNAILNQEGKLEEISLIKMR